MDGFAFHPYGDQLQRRRRPAADRLGPSGSRRPDQARATARQGLRRHRRRSAPGCRSSTTSTGSSRSCRQEKAVHYAGTEPATTRPVDELAQAAAYAQAIKLAYCQSNVAGILLFHARDEPGLSGWQSGLYYPDGTPKSSLGVVRDTMDAIASGALGKCARRDQARRRVRAAHPYDLAPVRPRLRLPRTAGAASGRIDHGVEERTLEPRQPAVVPARRPRRTRALQALGHVRARHAARNRRRALQRRVSGALAARGADTRRLRRQRRAASSSARSTTPSAIPGRRSTSSRRPASAPSGSRASGSRGSRRRPPRSSPCCRTSPRGPARRGSSSASTTRARRRRR